jgi:hypothetical protein
MRGSVRVTPHRQRNPCHAGNLLNGYGPSAEPYTQVAVRRAVSSPTGAS